MAFFRRAAGNLDLDWRDGGLYWGVSERLVREKRPRGRQADNMSAAFLNSLMSLKFIAGEL